MTEVEYLSGLAEAHEAVAGPSGAITGSTETRDVFHFHQPFYDFVQSTGIGDVELDGIFRSDFFGIAADAGTGTA